MSITLQICIILNYQIRKMIRDLKENVKRERHGAPLMLINRLTWIT